MIKRRFYRLDHADKDGASDDSSSSSDDSDVEPQLSDDNQVDESQEIQHPSISSSGYESEDSSTDELDADTSGLIAKDDDSESESDKDQLSYALPTKKDDSVTVTTKSEVLPVAGDVPNCVLKSKSVFKCRLCPKIVCLNEESLTTHLKSKRHARSQKLLNDGRLKRFLNSDGEEEEVTDDEDGETHAERHARILALAQQSQDVSTKKGRGRQRQRQRLKKKKQNSSEIPNSGQQKENRAKRRKKNTDGKSRV
ncbi:hypothetical protein RND81_08G225000 [Saponaria officinalis]|uniref:Uncharacterized protein n=1 Tax=Saponaria officinalis TaxID=3572 RepID=A0AAW1JB28_SAPOF